MISLREIPFFQFQRLLVDGDMTIFPEGTTEEQALIALEEFRRIANARKVDHAGMAEGNLVFWEMNISELQIYLNILAEAYIPEVCDLIRMKGFDYPLTTETYRQDLLSIVSEAQQWDVKRLEYEATVTALIPKDGEKPTYEYYARCTNAISTMIGSNIPDDINAMRWAQYYAQLIQNAEQAKKTADGKHR